MVRWAKTVAWLAAVSGLAEAWFGQMPAVVRRVERFQPVGTTGNFNESTAAPDTPDAPNCKELEARRNQTAALFRRPLSKQEYDKRNFMWLRCRSHKSHFFDMGGTWFGPDGKDVEEYLQTFGLIVYGFRYIHGGWGDAMVFFVPVIDMELKVSAGILRHIAKVAADRYRRTFYIVDCPAAVNDPGWATERSAIDGVRWPDAVSDRDDTIAIYNRQLFFKGVEEAVAGEGFG